MASAKAKEVALSRLRNRVESAKRFRDNEGYDDLWHRLVDLYRGRHFPASMSDEDKVVVNLAFSTINVIGPSVAVNHPKVTIHARKPEDFDRAVIAEGVIDYWWRHYDFHSEFRRAVDDFLILGFGWLKTSYRYVEEEEDLPEADVDRRLDEAIALADELAMEDPEGAGTLPTDDEILNDIETTHMVVKEDRPTLERVSPWDIYVDPEATSMYDIKWIAQRIIRPLEDVREDEKYDEAARRRVKGDTRTKDEWRPRGVTDEDVDFQRVTVWEFYDVAHGTIAVFTEGNAEDEDDFLVKPTDQPYEFGHPFVMLRNYDVPDYFYPMGELEAIEGLQQELNITRTSMMNDRKQSKRKWLYQPTAFGPQGVDALKSDVDNTMVPVEGNVDLATVVLPMPSQQLNPQMYQNSEIIEGDITNISGVNEYMRGALPEIRRTATEASIIQDAANSRAADKLAKVEKVIGFLGQRLLQLAQQFLTEAQVARIEGRNGQDVWFEFEPEDISGEFDFLVEAGSTQPKNEAQRQNQAMQMLTVLAPFAVPGGPININELLRHALTNGFGVKDPSKFLNGANGITDGLGGPAPTEEELMAGGGQVEPDPAAAMGQQMPPQPSMPAGAEEGALPPEILAQLQGQVGLNIPQ